MTLNKIIPDYKETMNIYTKIVEKTKIAVENAKLIEKRLKNTADNAYSFTPHSYVYEIIKKLKILLT